jgi:hypothetical protein
MDKKKIENAAWQLEKGIEVEHEHKPTYEKIDNFFKKNKKLPPEEDVYKWIAMDHLKEMSDYYTHLEKMEEKGGCK